MTIVLSFVIMVFFLRKDRGDMRGRVWICAVIDGRVGLGGWEGSIIVF